MSTTHASDGQFDNGPSIIVADTCSRLKNRQLYNQTNVHAVLPPLLN